MLVGREFVGSGAQLTWRRPSQALDYAAHGCTHTLRPQLTRFPLRSRVPSRVDSQAPERSSERSVSEV